MAILKILIWGLWEFDDVADLLFWRYRIFTDFEDVVFRELEDLICGFWGLWGFKDFEVCDLKTWGFEGFGDSKDLVTRRFSGILGFADSGILKT